MKPNNVLKLIAGASSIIQGCARSTLAKGHDFLEQHILQEKYVTREEFDILRELLTKYEQRLTRFEQDMAKE